MFDTMFGTNEVVRTNVLNNEAMFIDMMYQEEQMFSSYENGFETF
jgi:hypothetical protein